MKSDLPITPPLAPMEAKHAAKLPEGAHWQYEPKWDGFRCLVFKDGDEIYLQSKAEKPLARYFPDLVANVAAVKAKRFVLDGELLIPDREGLSFDKLLLRIHPAKSRVTALAEESPASFVAFDLLCTERGRSLLEAPLRERRAALERFADRYFDEALPLFLCPATTSLDAATRWPAQVGTALDGIIAKDLREHYRCGEREGMLKVKFLRTADCVVGGYRTSSSGAVVSLLLGLYDEENLLHYVGHAAFPNERGLATKLKKRTGKSAFTGRSPGGESRWSKGASTEWTPVRPELVAEVRYDHLTGKRFRHGTKLLRWRPDKRPDQCRMDQLRDESQGVLQLLTAA